MQLIDFITKGFTQKCIVYMNLPVLTSVEMDLSNDTNDKMSLFSVTAQLC